MATTVPPERELQMPAGSVRQLRCPVAPVNPGDDVSAVTVLCTLIPLTGGAEPLFADAPMTRDGSGVPRLFIGPYRAGERYLALLRADQDTDDQEGVSVRITVVASSGASA